MTRDLRPFPCFPFLSAKKAQVAQRAPGQWQWQDEQKTVPISEPVTLRGLCRALSPQQLSGRLYSQYAIGKLNFEIIHAPGSAKTLSKSQLYSIKKDVWSMLSMELITQLCKAIKLCYLLYLKSVCRLGCHVHFPTEFEFPQRFSEQMQISAPFQ